MEREEAFSMPESIISMEDDTIRVGQLVYSGNLFSQEYGIITAIHGEQTHPQGFGLVLNTTKMAELDIVFSSGERSYHVPENVIRHLPWKLFGNTFSASEIENAIHFAEARDQRKAIEKEAAKAKFIAEMERLRKEYPQLLVAADETDHRKRAAKNMRILLKQFKGCKFSVRTDDNSIRVSWMDGPTVPQVNEIINAFKAGNFDGMTDSYEYQESPWNELFGSAMYVFSDRGYSEDLLKRSVVYLWQRLPGNLHGIPQPENPAEVFTMTPRQIPELNMTFGEAVNSLAYQFDCLNSRYVRAYGCSGGFLIPESEAEAA